MGKTALVGDFGGTNARLALSTADGLENIQEYKCEAFSGPADVIAHYCTETGQHPTHGIFAIAGNASDPSNIVFTNGPWKQRSLDFTDTGLEKVVTLNDFAAICFSIGLLGPQDCETLVHGNAPFFPAETLNAATTSTMTKIPDSKPEHRFVTIGPGTGLGVGSGFVTTDGQFLVAGGEGGHTNFSPDTLEEFHLKQYLEATYCTYVTQETIASGPGLHRVFNGLCQLRGLHFSVRGPEDLIPLLEVGQGEISQTAKDTMALFAKTLGQSAATAALVNNARTVFIAGGVIPKLGRHFDTESLAIGMRANDLRLNNFMKDVPAVLIRHDQPGLLGAHTLFQLSR